MKLTIWSHAIPDDIIFLIFSKSTVKSLLRFSSVSKSINALIRSSIFVAAHHHNQIHNNSNNIIDCYVVHMPNDDREDQEPCSLRCGINKPSQKYNLLFPFRSYDLVGICQGLICFAKDLDVYIWNPFVGSMKIVPPSGSINDNVVYRFDFSKRSCDYKVIKQIINADKSLLTLEIYSLATDSWRRIEYRCFDWFINIRVHILFKRFIYWAGLPISESHESNGVLFRFDLDEEIFEKVTASELFLDKLEDSLIFSDTWNGILEGNRDLHVFVFYHGHYRISRDHYLVPVEESLMLFDQKDKKAY